MELYSCVCIAQSKFRSESNWKSVAWFIKYVYSLSPSSLTELHKTFIVFAEKKRQNKSDKDIHLKNWFYYLAEGGYYAAVSVGFTLNTN